MIAAVVVFVLWEYLRYSRRRARDQVQRLRVELKERDQAAEATSEPGEHTPVNLIRTEAIRASQNLTQQTKGNSYFRHVLATGEHTRS